MKKLIALLCAALLAFALPAIAQDKDAKAAPKAAAAAPAKAEDKLASAQLSPRAGCLCQSGRDSALHRRMIAETRYAALSEAN